MEGYTYNISIQTGVWKGFGTSARVGTIINGNQGSSGDILLTDPLARRKYFARGSVNNFTLTFPSSLGKLTDVRIWHDNSGSNPAWFLQDVVITDKQTEKMSYFFANQWLFLDERSGTIVLDIEAAEKDEITSLKPLFHARTARSLGEDTSGYQYSRDRRIIHSPDVSVYRVVCLSCSQQWLPTRCSSNLIEHQRIPLSLYHLL